MSQHFNAHIIEKKWQDYWEEKGTYHAPDTIKGKENFYCLSEFSYPSGNLHVGHWYAFALPDIYARFKRMSGYNVLYPTGFDAFGLPAENAAIKRGEDPKEWTWKHMDHMRSQLRTMGASFDWSREVVTSDPSYYRWTQAMFNTFYQHNLVYRDITKVNWCNSCKTILANEQVTAGVCERCDDNVIQKDMPQWMLRITEFADELIDDLDDLPWEDSMKQSQRAWIGRKKGSLIPFNVGDTTINVFTTRADTLFGVSYLVLAPEHEYVEKNKDRINNWDEVEQYLKEIEKKSDLDRQQSTQKTGVELKGITAINPINGQEIPVWIADYVLAHFGTGAVMAVPAHDERDYEFAQTFGLPIRYVIDSKQLHDQGVNTGHGTLIHSGDFSHLSTEEAIPKITEAAGGTLSTTYRLRDWGVSRQRYWGCPIPIVYDPDGKAHAVPDEHLPWLLPTDVDHKPDGTAPLARSQELKERTEKIFGKGWTPEVDTMDTFVDSSWYFYRYLDPQNNERFASPEKRASWIPVNAYFGGAEHTTMHLLYSRFWTKALYRLGLVTSKEPYQHRYNRGLILGPDGTKMSKSKGNIIDPDEVVAHVGADTVRSYLAFIGPFNEAGNYPWDPNGVVGVRRFLDRIYRLREKITDTLASSEETQKNIHNMINKVTEDINRRKLNTALSAMMVFVNYAEKQDALAKKDYLILIKLLAPFAPHLSEELWFEMGNDTSIHLSSWPEYDKTRIVEEEQTLAVQINGKVRAQITSSVEATEEDIQKLAKANVDIQKWIEGKEIKKVIYVPKKIINIVI